MWGIWEVPADDEGSYIQWKQSWSGSESSLGHILCHLQEELRTGWRRRVENSVTFHLLSSCSKCHFKSGERCSLDWVASHHTCQLAETGHLWLGDEAVLGCWTPACLRPVNVAWNIWGKPRCLTVTGCHAYGMCYSVVAFCLSALLIVLKAQSAEL